MPDLALQALALTISHLKQFGFERILCCGASFRSLSSRVEMNLSANTLQQLEFIAVIQAILSVGKQLKRLHIDEEYDDYGCNKIGVAIVQSALLRRLILTASSSKVLGNAVKLLSTLNKEAADKGDFTDLIIISKDQFPEVARARKALQLAKLDNFIGLYRNQFRNHKLEFTFVSGTTHLVENYVCPIFMEDSRPVQIQIHAGRHPVSNTDLEEKKSIGLCGQGLSLMRKATHRLRLLCWLTRRAVIYCLTKVYVIRSVGQCCCDFLFFLKYLSLAPMFESCLDMMGIEL